MSQVSRQFECNLPGCGRVFNRKEHLNRHLKSHDPQLQHRCPICGRRYARSDVLKRHVENHPQYSNSKRKQRSCVACHDRGIECDGNSPCSPCIQNSSECTRVVPKCQRGMDTPVNVDGRVNGDGQRQNDGEALLANHSGNIDYTDSLVPGNINQETMLQGTWPIPFSNTEPAVHLSSEFGVQHSDHAFSTTTYPSSNDSVPIMGDSPVTSVSTNNNQHEAMCNNSQNTATVWETSNQDNTIKRGEYTPFQAIDSLGLYGALHRGSPSTKRLVGVFFSEIHQYWPILHTPSFDMETVSEALLGAIIMLASWLEDGPEHKQLVPLVFDAASRFQLDLKPPLDLLQAALLSIIYAVYHLREEGMLARALNMSAVLISTCRYLGIFNGLYEIDDCIEDQFAFWRSQEQLNRLAFTVFRIDTYLSMLLDHPPSIRYQELCIPLPKSNELWASANEEERRQLQWDEPAGREKALFSFLIRDALDDQRKSRLPYHLLDMDRHLGICATQDKVWEVAREIHSSRSDELWSRVDPEERTTPHYTRFRQWHDEVKMDCELREDFPYICQPGDDGNTFCALTLMLWHMSSVKMHAPLNTIRVQGFYYKSLPGASVPTRTRRSHLLGWTTTGCPRRALWNAAQIAGIFMVESGKPGGRSRIRLNPLAIAAALMSAVVTCVYAFHIRACAACTGSQPGFSVDLINATEDDPDLANWLATSQGLPLWGANRIPVCKCRVGELAAWFQAALAGDKSAEMELVLFLAELNRE
ncbi:fungal-specific transcription factor domain-containing protein [Biscogniauxia marginata]|nr:fungal-specific transcription factor domain-containing protein [Biscogniauxia marginata]